MPRAKPSISFQCSTKQATQCSFEGGAGPQNHKYRKTWRECRRHTKEHECRHAPLDYGNASPDVGKRPQDKGAKKNSQHHADHQDNILPVAWIPLILEASCQVGEHVALHGQKGSGQRNNNNHSGKQPGGTEIMQLFMASTPVLDGRCVERDIQTGFVNSAVHRQISKDTPTKTE